jgi:putative FmdB family regulatory protein
VPLFEYACKKCGHEFEALVIGAKTPACPKCKSEELEKRVSSVAFAGVGATSFGRPSGGCGPAGGGGG